MSVKRLPTTETYTLSLHDALPIYGTCSRSTLPSVLKSSPVRCVTVPVPPEPKLNFPGSGGTGTVTQSFSPRRIDRKSTRLNSSHGYTSYAVFCFKKKTDFNKPKLR